MALIGQPDLIFLDEPTAAMDPRSRRCVWEVIRKARGGEASNEVKTELANPNDKPHHRSAVVLTTHFLDEAECLGETIAIMKDGILACAGSSLELKRGFGRGYTVTLTHSDPSPHNLELAVSKIRELIQDATSAFLGNTGSAKGEEASRDAGDVGKAPLAAAGVSGGGNEEMFPITVSAAEINLRVPYSFPPLGLERLLAQLEDRLDELCCMDLVLSTSSLEQVFLDIAASTEAALQHTDGAKESGTPSAIDGDQSTRNRDSTLVAVRGDDDDEQHAKILESLVFVKQDREKPRSALGCCVLRGNLVCTMVRVRILELARGSSSLFSKVVLPLVFLVAAFGVGLSFSDTTGGLVRSDPLRVDPASILVGAGGINSAPENCSDPWELAVIPGSGSSQEPQYVEVANLTTSLASCASPVVRTFDSATALIEEATPVMTAGDDTGTNFRNVSEARMVGGFVYEAGGPLQALGLPWADYGGVVHQTVGVVFNSSLVHSLPLLLNAYGRAAVRASVAGVAGQTAASSIDIVVDVHPLPYVGNCMLGYCTLVFWKPVSPNV